MPNKNQTAIPKIRKGDTTRTSNQGRKLASEGDMEGKKRDPQVDESDKTPIAGRRKAERPKARKY